MATEKDLLNAVRQHLEDNGELGRIKTEMQKEVMKKLDSSSSLNRVKKPELPRDVFILNELIREYFDWIGYKYTLSVLKTECEFGKPPLDRGFLAQDLGVDETEETKKMPLLFSLIETFKSLKSTPEN